MTQRQLARNTVPAGQGRSCPVSLDAASLPKSALILMASATHPRENTNTFSTDPSGFTRIFVMRQDKLTVGMWQRTAAPATTKVTVASSGETYGIQATLIEETEAAQASLVDKFARNGNNPEKQPGSKFPNSGSTGTLAAANEVIYGLIVNRYGSTTQTGFTGGLGQVSQTLSSGTEPDHDRTRMTIFRLKTSSTAAVTLGAQLSANRDWVAGVVTLRGGSLGPLRMTSKNAPPVLTVGGRGRVSLFGPVRSRNAPPVLAVGGRGWIGPFEWQFRLGGRNGLLIGAGTDYDVESVVGLGGADIRTSDGELSREAGAHRGIDLQGVRQVLFQTNFPSDDEQVTQRLLAALRPQREQDWPMYFRLPGMPVQVIWCRPMSLSREDSVTTSVIRDQQFGLLAVDPRIYSARLHRVPIPVATSDTVVEVASVINAGNGNAHPVIRITGAPTTQVDHIELVNATPDSSFEIEGILPPLGQLVGDMPGLVTAAPRLTVTLDGQNKYGAWVYPRDPFYIAPGVNAIYLRTRPAGAAVNCVLEYFDTWDL